MATQNVPHSNPHSRISKTQNEESNSGIVREAGRQNILSVDDEAASQVILRRELDHNSGAAVGNVCNGFMHVDCVFRSLSGQGNEEMEGWNAYGLSGPPRQYDENIRNYLKSRGGADASEFVREPQLELVRVAVRK